jgi:hypothetical protein
MSSSAKETRTLAAWASIPKRIRKAVAGLSARGLMACGGSEGWSIQEYAHHLVEANLVASTIFLAGVGKPGTQYDWSWLIPDRQWMRRLGYGRVPVEPAITLLEALCTHVVGIARQTPGSLRRRVRLVGSPGTRSRSRTLREVLEDECGHARHHLRDIAITQTTRARRRRRRGSA